jgi:glycosyltransferase involved in cell wall biosynthesis
LGDGPLKNKMQAFVNEEKLTSYIHFKGWVSKETMLKEYQSAHVQVISSEAEAMSIAALEALSCGLYVFSTPVSGNTDLIVDNLNGELFDFANYTDLAEKLNKYIEKKFKKNFRIEDAFLKDFREKYDWKKIVKQLENAVI